MRNPTRSAVAGAILGAFMLTSSGALGATATPRVEGPRSTIGVAPFGPGSARTPEEESGPVLPDVAGLLAAELGTRSSARVVAPNEMIRGPGGKRATPDLAAGDVRTWASLNDVDSVVLGYAERSKAGGLHVDVELRSGHSGAAEADYRLEPASDPDVPSAVRKLATLILADLAQVEPAPALPPVSTPAGGRDDGASSGDAAAGADTGDAERADGDDRLSLMPGAKNDDPISINSEELEVVPLDGGRRLVFSRNVVVIQGDIRLDADRLEAIYPAGASRPETLVAEGNVQVEQGERNGKCEQATYERSLQTIVCRGKAEVVQGCDRVRGREIEFDLERERVHVTGAASVLIRPEEDGECIGKGRGGRPLN
jgi:lipopolysaccharide transport protein LptA